MSNGPLGKYFFGPDDGISFYGPPVTDAKRAHNLENLARLDAKLAEEDARLQAEWTKLRRHYTSAMQKQQLTPDQEFDLLMRRLDNSPDHADLKEAIERHTAMKYFAEAVRELIAKGEA